MTLDVFSSYEEFKNIPIDVLQQSIDNAIEWHEEQKLVNFEHFKMGPKYMEFYAASKLAKERLLLGGNRSLKTHACLFELAFHLTGVYPPNWPGHKFTHHIRALAACINLELTNDVIVGKLFHGEMNGSIIVPPIIHESYVVGIDGKYSGPSGCPKIISIRHASGGISTLKLKCYTQKDRVFQSEFFHYVLLDENPELALFNEALMRLTSSEKTLMVVSTWPTRVAAPTVMEFINNAPDGEIKKKRYYTTVSMYDNPYLTEEAIKEAEESLPAWEREARIYGIPVFGHGKVFIMPESEILIEPFPIPKHFAYIYGLDPSATSGGTYGFVLLAHDRDRDVVYASADYKLSNATPTEHASNILRIIPSWNPPGMNDPAGGGENPHTKEKTLDFLRQKAGLNLIKAKKVQGTKEAVIDQIYERVRSGRFKIMWNQGYGCNHLMHEWRQYSRDDKGLIIKRNDHCIDALFYALDGLENAVTENQYQRQYYNSYGAPSYV